MASVAPPPPYTVTITQVLPKPTAPPAPAAPVATAPPRPVIEDESTTIVSDTDLATHIPDPPTAYPVPPPLHTPAVAAATSIAAVAASAAPAVPRQSLDAARPTRQGARGSLAHFTTPTPINEVAPAPVHVLVQVCFLGDESLGELCLSQESSVPEEPAGCLGRLRGSLTSATSSVSSCFVYVFCCCKRSDERQ